MSLKILVLSDIHQHFDAALAAYQVESPDVVFDCGDHEDVFNLFDVTPHFYVLGNHEPRMIDADVRNGPMPSRLNTGQVVRVLNGDCSTRVSGVGGNYSDKLHLTEKEYGSCVTPEAIDSLRIIPENGLDVLLLHDSPLNNFSSPKSSRLAKMMVDEIDRISPKIVFAGHVGRYSEEETPGEVRVVTLDDIAKGYCVLNVDGSRYDLQRRIAVHARGGKD